MTATHSAGHGKLACPQSLRPLFPNCRGSFSAHGPRVRTLGIFTAALLYTGTFLPAARADEVSYAISIQNHHFSPATVSVKAGQKIKLIVTNSGSKPAEFESAELNREKVIAGGTSAVIYVGPLEPGSYPFFDDFDPSNKGQIVAK